MEATNQGPPATIWRVGISDYKIAKHPDTLVTIGLGSCVGIALFDPRTKIGGLSHIMLPDSTYFKDQKKWEKFANLAIPRMAEEIKEASGSSRLVAKIAGGASMFQLRTTTPENQIGYRNIEAVKATLEELDIPILGEHTGGKKGRTMMVELDTFEVIVRMVDREQFVL